MGRSIEVVFLGTAAAVPTREKHTSSVLVRDWHGRNILIDAGEGTQHRMLELGISPNDIDYIAITHSHGDHINGVAGLLQTMGLMGRKRPLIVIGAYTVVDFIKEVLEAEQRLLGYPIEYYVLSNNAIYGSLILERRGGDLLYLRWYKTCHTRDSYGFVLDWMLRPRIRTTQIRNLSKNEWLNLTNELVRKFGYSITRISYTGDSGPCPTTAYASKGSRILIHDATLSADNAEEAHSKGHSTPVDAAKIALEAGVDLLVLTHISARYRGYESRKLLEEAKRIYSNVILAYDKMRIKISPTIQEVDPTQIRVDL